MPEKGWKVTKNRVLGASLQFWGVAEPLYMGVRRSLAPIYGGILGIAQNVALSTDMILIFVLVASGGARFCYRTASGRQGGLR